MSDEEEGSLIKLVRNETAQGFAKLVTPILITVIGILLSNDIADAKKSLSDHTLSITALNSKMDILSLKIDGILTKDLDDLKQSVKETKAMRDQQIRDLQQRMDNIEGTPHRSVQ